MRYDQVKACVERAMELDGRELPKERRLEDAIVATAQALAVTDDEVRACLELEVA